MIDQVRKNIKDYFSDLQFDEPTHRYTLRGQNLSSVSHFIGKYKQKFDAEKIAPYTAAKRGISVEEVLKEWEDNKNRACELGTKVHLFGENYVNNGFVGEPTDGYEEAIVKFWNTKPDYIEPLIMELQMYSERFGIAGTADIICYNKNTNKLKILDWKGLDINTPIPTEKGFKKMGELTLEDKVFDKDGDLVNIKNISNIHYKKCYKITFDNGEEIISDFEHRWLISTLTHTVKQKNKKRKPITKRKDFILTTEEIYTHLQDPLNKISYKGLKIFNPKPIKLPKSSLPIDPYVFGVWLGDGHSADGKITQGNIKVWKEIKKRGYKIGKDVSGGGCGKAQTRTIFGLESELRKLNLLKNKHLPEMFLFSSYEDRLDILRGLMDSDGYFHPKRKRFVMKVGRKWQCEVTAQLVASLGWKPTQMKTFSKCNGKRFDTWDCCFNTDGVNPFLCRNQNININLTTTSNYRRILKCELVETVPTKCIEVNSPSNTYLFGKTFTVTHNTNHDLFKVYKEQKMLSPFDNYLANALNGYKLQLSMYQLLLEQTGYEVEDRTIIWLKPNGTFECYKTEDLTKTLLEELSKNR